MKELVEKLSTHSKLSEKEAYKFIVNISEEKFNATQLVACMSFLVKRPISVEELTGFKNALLDLSVKVCLDKEAIDVCGTGGDQKDTFNISTLSAIVLAASGVPVAKHGNRGASSVSGSSDILKHLGYKFKTDSNELNAELDNYNICFMHAPLFHPTLKHVAIQRKELGIRTFFNLLGPLVNPARVKHKYIGVYNQEVGRLYNYVLQKENSNYNIVHSIDGYDEISLTGSFKCISNETEMMYEPMDLGYDNLLKNELFGGDTIEESGRIFDNVLNNKATKAQTNVVTINSAFAMQVYYPAKSINECVSICKETIESKKAQHLFKNLINQN
ncbi:MAG TPA: anthranilate phosphoribosyltransferase [Bacteroidia bacterium]|nr:anthranilate phosphoribosyltransferase [Bacteroidia bacterium]